MVVSGDSLITVNKSEDLKELFINLILQSESILCCRVSPKQKASIVKMVRSALPDARTLAIGDGANDVNMIVAANIGVGIKGLEG